LTRKFGNCDRSTAVRWLLEGEFPDNQDESFFEYNHGLPYGYLRNFP
jgi:hypothetical protein